MIRGNWQHENEYVSLEWLRSFNKGVTIKQKLDVSNLDDFEEACSKTMNSHHDFKG